MGITPNRDQFAALATAPDDGPAQPEYDEAHAHRESGLERTVVVACTPRIVNLERGEVV